MSQFRGSDFSVRSVLRRGSPGAERSTDEQAGVTPPGKKKRSKALEPIRCPRCATVNGPTDNFCRKCGFALTEEATAEFDSVSADVRKLTNYLALLLQAAEMLQLGMSAPKRS